MKRMLRSIGLLIIYAALTAFYAQSGTAWAAAIWGVVVGQHMTTVMEAISDWWENE